MLKQQPNGQKKKRNKRGHAKEAEKNDRDCG